jgi:hypothetical protein
VTSADGNDGVTLLLGPGGLWVSTDSHKVVVLNVKAGPEAGDCSTSLGEPARRRFSSSVRRACMTPQSLAVG